MLLLDCVAQSEIAMRFLNGNKQVLWVVLSLFWFQAFGAEPNRNALRTRDFEAVQEYVNSKRTIPLEEKEKNISIGADVRFIWAAVQENVEGRNLRGDGGFAKEIEGNGVIRSDELKLGDKCLIPFSTNEFNVELNLYFDYVCDRSWAVAWLQFDNLAGSERSFKTCCQDPEGFHGGGACGAICLKKAYIGYNICVNGCARLDVELGRRPLYNVFDSRVQFQSRFDGLLFKYAHTMGQDRDFYHNIGFFIVDQRSNHYAWVTELGLTNIRGSGVTLKYSYIDWRSFLIHDRNRCLVKHPHGVDYQISQWTVHYDFLNKWLCCIPTKLYGAFLLNSAAKGWDRSNLRKENLAWYAGFILGQVCKEGDWALDINYQYVEAQAIPPQDVSGIGERSNLLRETFTADGRGFTNYKGWRMEFLYALTDNLAIDATLEFLSQIHRTIGGKHTYSMFELSAIYAF